MGTLAAGIKDIFSPVKTTGTNVMLCGNDGTPDGHITFSNLKNAILTFDTTPIANSTNPVTSGGLYNLMKSPPLPIAFESPITKEIVAKKFGGEAGGLTGIAGIDGEVTYQQAAKDIGWTAWSNMFKDANANAPFTELKYFNPTNAHRFQSNAFLNSKFTKLVFPEGFAILPTGNADTQVSGAYIELPSSITQIDNRNFSNGYDYILKIHATTPPSIGTTGNSGLAHIYVPSASVDTYKAATGWSTYASIIEGF